MRTPICLDESITSARVAADAIALGACSIVNIKAGRVGGYLEARRVHDVCVEHGVPVWCGGMLETGLGRAANVALAALPGFTLPGDTSASGRYYEEDITEPFVLATAVSTCRPGPGLGVSPIPEQLERFTIVRSRRALRGRSVVGREQAELQLDHEALVGVLEVELEELDEAPHPVAEGVRMDGDPGRGLGDVAERIEVGAQRGRIRAAVLGVVGEDALELAAHEPRMVGAELAQLQQHDLAPYVLDRCDRPRARADAQHPEDPLGLPSRAGDLATPSTVEPTAARAACRAAPRRACRCAGRARDPPPVELALVLEERVDGLAERDRRGMPRGLAVDDDESTSRSRCRSSIPARRRRARTRAPRGRGGGEAQPPRVFLRRAAPVEHGQKHLGAHPPLDVPRGAGLDHVRRGDAGSLREGALGLLVEPVLVVDRPDRADRRLPARMAIAERGFRSSIVGQMALENPRSVGVSAVMTPVLERRGGRARACPASRVPAGRGSRRRRAASIGWSRVE